MWINNLLLQLISHLRCCQKHILVHVQLQHLTWVSHQVNSRCCWRVKTWRGHWTQTVGLLCVISWRRRWRSVDASASVTPTQWATVTVVYLFSVHLCSRWSSSLRVLSLSTQQEIAAFSLLNSDWICSDITGPARSDKSVDWFCGSSSSSEAAAVDVAEKVV